MRKAIACSLVVVAGILAFLIWGGVRGHAVQAASRAPLRSTTTKPVANVVLSPVRISFAAEQRSPGPGLASAAEQERFPERARRNASRAVVDDISAGFLSGRQLPDTVAGAFLELVCQERLSALRVALAARSQGRRWIDDPELAQEVVQAATAQDEEIKSLLGSEAHQRFLDYRSTSNLRTTLIQVDDKLEAPQALTDDQVDALARAFMALVPPAKAVRAPAYAVLQLIGMPIAEPMLNAAASILTPAQMAALRAVRADQLNAIQNPWTAGTIGSPNAHNPGTGTH